MASVPKRKGRDCRVPRAPGLMPFVHERQQPRDGTCSVCCAVGRVWRFAEEPLPRVGRYTLVVGEALCQPCLDMCVQEALVPEDDDAASP